MTPKNFYLNKKVPFTIRRTRKAFWIEYLCSLSLFLVWVYSKIVGIQLKKEIEYFLLFIIVTIPLTVEFFRFLLKYEIGEEKIEIIKGLIKQDKKNVYYRPLGFIIPDIDIKQGRIERLLNYGTISVEVGGKNSFEIREIHCPNGAMKVIEQQIKIEKEKERHTQ